MFRQIDQVAKGLSAIGVRSEDNVTIFSVNTPETIILVFALNKLGAVPCLEYVTESSKDAIKAVNHYKSRIVVVLDTLLSRFMDLADVKIVQHVIVLPLIRSMPILKKTVMSFKTHKTHCLHEIPYADLIAKGKGLSLNSQPYKKKIQQ